MKAHIDRFGRVVIPRKLRELMHLVPGTEVEIAEHGGKLEIERVESPAQMTVLPSGLIVLHGELEGEYVDYVAKSREDRIRSILGQ